ncbi:MAG: cation:proton antiporter [Eubacteriales bacterium]|nr:cation:proton antiporter [Eubacteriales bacterium]
MPKVDLLDHVSSGNAFILAISMILFTAFLASRLTKKLRLPNVSGYILAGVLIGPQVLALIPRSTLGNLSIISDIALSFIAFDVGRYFRFGDLKKSGFGIVLLTFLESASAAILVSLAMFYIFHLSLDFSLLLGAIASATAPASTMMTIRQYRAKGRFVNTLIQVAAFDDAVCLLLFSMVIAFVNANDAGDGVHFAAIAKPIAYNLFALLIGVLAGFFLVLVITLKRSKDNRLILAVASIFAVCGLCGLLAVSPLLACMASGAIYVNFKSDTKLFSQVNKFSPPIMIIFFIVSGMNLDIFALVHIGGIGLAYFLIRILGKFFGAYLGARIARMEAKICRYLGFALIPQAGVAIGLAFMGRRALPTNQGELLLSIILASSVLYELIGPVSAKFAILRAAKLPSVADELPELSPEISHVKFEIEAKK